MAQNLSQEAYADVLGFHRTYMGGLERGEATSPSRAWSGSPTGLESTRSIFSELRRRAPHGHRPDLHRARRYDLSMTKAELHRQIDAMTEEEAAEAKLIYAPDWPSKATSIEEIRKRTGTTPMSREDFDRHFGSLPTDGEG